MSISSTAATTLANLKTYLKVSVSDTSKDELFELLIDSCTLAAEEYLGRYIVQRTITEEPYDCENHHSRYLQLKQYPVASVTTILEDGLALDSAILKTDLYNGIIKKATPWRGTVLATYSAGLSSNTASVSKNIQLAIWQWVADILSTQDASGAKSETLGDYSINYYDEHKMPQSVELLLEGYRRADL